MTPEEIGARLASVLGGSRPGSPESSDGPESPGSPGDITVTLSGGGPFARATVDVPVGRWRAAVEKGRDDPELNLDFFDWLSAVDEQDGGFDLVVHTWSTVKRHGVLIRTRLADRVAPQAPSIVDIYPGAAWHERETREMFGIAFTDPADSSLSDGRPLLLPEEFEGHPLRKEFVLATRVAKPWPGAKEPGESGHGGPAKRQPMRPPGVPDPREWGPGAGAVPPEEERPRRPAADRPARPPRTPRTPASTTPPTEPPPAAEEA
jgi:NADH-quinone oxidoreductase subunit C